MARQPAEINLTGKQGRTFTQSIAYKVNGSLVNFAGYTGKMQIRTKPSASTALLTLTNGSGLTLSNGASGWNVVITISAAQMETLPVGTLWHDIELSSAGVDLDFAEGTFTVKVPVTRG